VLSCMRFWRFWRFYVLANSGSTPTSAFEFYVDALMCSHIEVERDRCDSTDPAPPSCIMSDDKRKHRTELRRLSRRQTEARITAGDLDPELDFVCPLCNGIFSCYQGATISTFVYANVGLLDPRKFLKNLHYSLRHLLRPRYSPRR
jgi:hypothetical protein